MIVRLKYLFGGPAVCVMAVLLLSGCLQAIGLDDKDRLPFRGDGGVDIWTDDQLEAAWDWETVDFDVEGVEGVEGVEWVEGMDVPSEDMTVEEEIGVARPIQWLSILGGNFMMGCSTGDSRCDSNEYPQHAVTVTAFSITDTEITQAQYEEEMGANPSGHAGCPDCPVENVTWAQATAFCTAVVGRLPSEAEWEFAARGGTEDMYYCGSSSGCVGTIAWYLTNSEDATNEVAGKTPNDYGLYDTSGNVWEWVEDCWHETFTGAPGTSTAWESAGTCTDGGIRRGGSYASGVGDIRVSKRLQQAPAETSGEIGFRCVK